MKYQLTLAAIAATVSAGTATVKSFCGAPVYLYAVDANRNPQSATKVLNYGDSYTEQYQTLASGGVSIKLSRTPTLGSSTITQFEYTYQPGVMIWYDGSNVNCVGPDCPFYKDGIHMVTSVGSCPTRTCPPSQQCDGFYNLFNDDWNSLGCTPSADITMYLCSTDGNAPTTAETGLFPNLLSSVGGIVGGLLGGSSGSGAGAAPVANNVQPATSSPSTAAAPPPVAVANQVSVPASAAPAASSAPAAAPIYRMEALNIPALSSHKHKRAAMNRHSHMRRHAHAHRS